MASNAEDGRRGSEPGLLVRVGRGSETESVHRVDGLVAGPGPEEEIRFGDPEVRAFWRSSFKPFQALPLVEDGAAEAFGFGPEELALACASHRGTPVHVELAAAMLKRLGLTEDALACGPQPPFDSEAARALARGGGEPGRLHNNCSGKHLGMLALALHRGWPVRGYERRDHPVQGRIRAALSRWIDVDPDAVPWATDGCRAPTPLLPLRRMAVAYARLARSKRPEAAAVVYAMTSHPELVSGRGGLATAVMEATGGRVLAKEGAEGVFCAAAGEEGWGCALKVEDGGKRALGPALVEMLAAAGLLSPAELERLAPERQPAVLDSGGSPVGSLRAEVRSRPAPAEELR